MSSNTEQLNQGGYDDTPWTKRELLAAAWQAGKYIGWEGMEEYDDHAPDDGD